jgi:D-alanyl-D-alanine endopeptidase (penicillin-binding protein 7)
MADINTGFVFVEKASTEKLPISSLTNIMTAVISDEIYRDDRKVSVNISGEKTGIISDMKNGDVLTITEMLRPLLIGGKDVAGDSIAHSAGKNMFIGLMNIKARALKMTDTKFADSIGTNPENVSTASDMFRLVSYFYRKHSYLSKVTIAKNYKIDESSLRKSYSGTNNSGLIDQSISMVQQGETHDSKQVATSIFNVPINGKDRKIAVVVLGSSSKYEDTLSLVNWLKDNYNSQELSVNY